MILSASVLSMSVLPASIFSTPILSTFFFFHFLGFGFVMYFLPSIIALAREQARPAGDLPAHISFWDGA